MDTEADGEPRVVLFDDGRSILRFATYASPCTTNDS
jgi:hypothetical protein